MQGRAELALVGMTDRHVRLVSFKMHTWSGGCMPVEREHEAQVYRIAVAEQHRGSTLSIVGEPCSYYLRATAGREVYD